MRESLPVSCSVLLSVVPWLFGREESKASSDFSLHFEALVGYFWRAPDHGPADVPARKDSSLMFSASHLTTHRRRQRFALVLLVLGLLLVPVQCSVGLHSIFTASSSLVVATPVPETPHQLASDHDAAHDRDASDASDGLRSSAPEQRTPVPITSLLVDHPYSVAISRFVASVDFLTAHLPLVIVMMLTPDAVSVAPEPPPPREIA